MLKALAESFCGQDEETLLQTYNPLGKSIASYAAPVWSTNASNSSFKKIQTAQNAGLRTVTGAYKMVSIDHLHEESLTLRVKDHSDMFSAQYIVNCLEEDHVSYGITIQEPKPRPMKETLHSRHHSTVLPRLDSSRMESHQNLHTHAVDSVIQLQRNNRVLKKRPPPISDEHQRLNRRQRCTLSQLRSGHCHLLQDYKHMVLGEPSDICIDGGASPQDLFACKTRPTDLSPEDLWRKPVGSIRAFSYLDNGNLDDGPGRGKQQQQPGTVLRYAPVGKQCYDMSMSGRDAVFTTCPCLVGTQLFGMPWSRRSFKTCMVITQFYDMPWSGRRSTTCPGWDAVLRHALVRMQFYNISGSERNLTSYPGQNAVLRHAQFGMQLFDMPWSRHSFLTCLFGMLFYGMP